MAAARGGRGGRRESRRFRQLAVLPRDYWTSSVWSAWLTRVEEAHPTKVNWRQALLTWILLNVFSGSLPILVWAFVAHFAPNHSGWDALLRPEISMVAAVISIRSLLDLFLHLATAERSPGTRDIIAVAAQLAVALFSMLLFILTAKDPLLPEQDFQVEWAPFNLFVASQGLAGLVAVLRSETQENSGAP